MLLLLVEPGTEREWLLKAHIDAAKFELNDAGVEEEAGEAATRGKARMKVGGRRRRHRKVGTGLEGRESQTILKLR